MILTKKQGKEFEEAVRPLIKFLNDNCHPHVHVVVDCTRAELAEGVYAAVIKDYLKD